MGSELLTFKRVVEENTLNNPEPTNFREIREVDAVKLCEKDKKDNFFYSEKNGANRFDGNRNQKV